MVRRPVVVVIALGLLSTTATAAFGTTPHPRVRVSVPAWGAYLGAYVNPDGASGPTQEKADVNALEQAMGRRLDIDHHFYPWASAFPTWRETWDGQMGRISLDTWNGATSAAINNGSQDAMIRSRANAVKAFKAPLLIRLLPEMDAITKTSTTGTPAQFISAWKRVVGIFRAQGATNAEWVWCPNAFHFSDGTSQKYYPGASWVDWVCADGYNWSPVTPGGSPTTTWTSFHDEFARYYAWAVNQNKPIMVGETGAMEYPGMPKRKATWITAMGNAVRNTFTKIKAVMWFDCIGGSNQGSRSFDWRLVTSSATQSAWVAVGKLGWFHQPH
jgi:glycosyl hydrolase family 26